MSESICTLKHVPNQREVLDQVFRALADGTRRDLVERLIDGPISVGELARPLTMSLPAVMQHLQVLEACGLIRSAKVGRVRTCHIEPAALRLAESWLGQQRTDWEHRLDQLEDLLTGEADSPGNTDARHTAGTHDAAGTHDTAGTHDAGSSATSTGEQL